MILLHEISPWDPLRNTPMRELQVECRNLKSKRWQAIKSWKIARATYNELGAVWHDLNEFRIP